MSRPNFFGRKLRILAFATGLTAFTGSGVSHAEYFTPGKDVAPFSALQNGDYVWHPEASPAGPVLIVVSIPEQRIFVYRNGVRIGRSTVSTGRPGHPTPTGVFTILQKQVDHVSSIYKGAEMPYMERLTWGGIALHAGDLPGFADSHGCVRLPLAFAQKLFTVTGKGTTVMITDGATTPDTSGHPGLLLAPQGAEATGADTVAGDDYEWNPQEAPTGPVSIVFSSKSSRIYVFRDGIEIGRCAVGGSADLKMGIHAYAALDKFDEKGRREWSVINTAGDNRAPNIYDLARKISIPPAFLKQVRTVVQPGTTLVISDAPVDRSEPIAKNVNILSTTYEGTKGH